MFTINNAKFATFSQAMSVAVLHCRQRNEGAQIRSANGTLLADCQPVAGTSEVSVAATDIGKPYVLELA